MESLNLTCINFMPTVINTLKKKSKKKLVLIYPKTKKFQKPLKVFEYEENFELTVVPFDLDKGNLVDFSINL